MTPRDSSLDSWITQMLSHEEFLHMGHLQRKRDMNLGMGWIYYGLGRLIRSQSAVVIGSWRGFVPLIIAKALSDNLEGGKVTFIDPSKVDDFWKSPDRVRAHFEKFGASNIVHYPQTTQEFVTTQSYHDLEDLGLVMVDGYHSYEQSKFDFQAFAEKLAPNGMIFLHDSCSTAQSDIYGKGREYQMGVKYFVDELKKEPRWQVLDLPFAKGLTLVRKA